MNFVPPPSPRGIEPRGVKTELPKKPEKQEEGFFDRIFDWIKGHFWGGPKQAEKVDVVLSTKEMVKRDVEVAEKKSVGDIAIGKGIEQPKADILEEVEELGVPEFFAEEVVVAQKEVKGEKPVQVKAVELSQLSFKDTEFQEAAKYVDGKMEKLEKAIYNEIAEPFKESWDTLFKKINGEIVNGKSYEEISKKYGEEWKQFQIGFGEVFGYAGKGLSAQEIEDLKVYQKTSEFGFNLRTLSDRALYEDFKALFSMRWAKELRKNTPLQDSIQLMADTKKAENARTKQEMKRLLAEGGPLKVDLDASAKARYEKVLSGAKIQDYSAEEIKVAQTVVSKFYEAFKERFGDKMDMQIWRAVVAREPMLAKAEVLLFQKQYDNIKIEYQRRELLAKKDAGELMPDELLIVERELGSLESFQNIVSLFFKSTIPWNPVEGPQSIREEGSKVAINAVPIKELGEMLAKATKSVAGDSWGEAITEQVNKFDKASMQLGTEITTGLENVKNAGQWSVDKNRYIVRDFTIEAKEGVVARGIKWLMQQVVEPPKRMLEAEKMLPWLAKYAKAAAVGGVAMGARELWHGRVPSVEKLAMGATAGIFARAYKGEILTGITFGLPGAAVAAGIVVAIGGTGALFATGGLFAIGLGAVLFGLFGVWAMYHTKMGENIREAVANFVYSSDAAWFDTWNEKVERADLGRVCFNRAAEIAEARRGQMYLRTELAQDPRYKSLEDICRDLNLSLKTRDEFLEQVRRNPRALNEPGQFKEFLIKTPAVYEELKTVNESNETKIAQIINSYRDRNEGALKVGLNGRYENLKNELKVFDMRLLDIMSEIEDKKNENVLKYDDNLKEFLKNRGISEETIDRVFADVNKLRAGKTTLEDASRVTQALAGAKGVVGGVFGTVGNVAAYFGSFWSAEKSSEEIESEELAKIEEKLKKQADYNRDAALVQVVLALREVVKQKDMLADEGELKKLLTDIGFESEQIDGLYKIYDKRSARMDVTGVKAKMLADEDLMEKFLADQDQRALGLQEAVLAFDIIVEGQKNGLLNSDADLPTDKELETIKSQLPSDEAVLAMIKNDEKMHIPSTIPSKIPNDRALMVRFGLLKRDTEGIVPLNKLSLEDQKTFSTKKEAYIDNFDKLRIGMKRAELMKAAVDNLIQTKKDEYVAKVLTQGMSDEEKIERIASRNLEILQEYNL